MNFDNPLINQGRISKGIPTGRTAAIDRARTLEELKNYHNNPDRRVKCKVMDL